MHLVFNWIFYLGWIATINSLISWFIKYLWIIYHLATIYYQNHQLHLYMRTWLWLTDAKSCFESSKIDFTGPNVHGTSPLVPSNHLTCCSTPRALTVLLNSKSMSGSNFGESMYALEALYLLNPIRSAKCAVSAPLRPWYDPISTCGSGWCLTAQEASR